MAVNTFKIQSPIPNGKIPALSRGIEIRKTICSICNPLSHCGIDAYVKDGVVIKVEGTGENPHNQGTLCSKGAASRQYIYHPDRIRFPLLRKGDRDSGTFEPISWDEALDRIAGELLRIREESGPESIAFYAGYPKWMRPFLKRLAHSFGSPNYCSESSTCSAGALLASKLNYGVAARADMSKSNCLMVWSTNPFYSNTSAARKLLDVIERGVHVIEVGPLITPLTSHADIHLRIRPGTSGALALSMAHVIIEERLFDRKFIEEWTIGFKEYLAYVQQFPPALGEQITGVSAELIQRAARLYATTKPAAILTGPNATVHHTNGIQNHRAITALIGLTGNFDREGGNYVAPPSYLYVVNGVVTRQAAFEQSRPWEEMAPRIGEDRYPVWCRLIPEAQAIHLPFQIQQRKPYPVRAVVGFGINHRMWPGSDFMCDSLKKLDFFVDVDLFMTDTARLADLVLPACSSFERSELKFYPEQYVIWTSPVIEPIGESRPDVDVILDLASRITPEDALLKKGYEGCMDWILKPTGLCVSELKRHPGGCPIQHVRMPPYQKYQDAGFSTPSGKMEFTSAVLKEMGFDPLPQYREPNFSRPATPDMSETFPLILTTGARLPMLVHSRTYRLPWIRYLHPDPMVDIHPMDARERKISSGDWVELSTRRGRIRVKAHLTETVPSGTINMYHGYPGADVNEVIEPDYVDPISGYPGFKSLLCEVRRISGKAKDSA